MWPTICESFWKTVLIFDIVRTSKSMLTQIKRDNLKNLTFLQRCHDYTVNIFCSDVLNTYSNVQILTEILNQKVVNMYLCRSFT
jgi:hypothetical protein